MTKRVSSLAGTVQRETEPDFYAVGWSEGIGDPDSVNATVFIPRVLGVSLPSSPSQGLTGA